MRCAWTHTFIHFFTRIAMTTSISPSSPTRDSAIAQTSEGFSSDEFDALDHILDDIRTRDDEAPQWEFCEGFMAAVLCSRRPIATDEAWEVLLGSGDSDGDIAFKDAAQRQQFLNLWLKRQGEVHMQLDADITALDDDAAYSPEVMDVRGAIATLPADCRRRHPVVCAGVGIGLYVCRRKLA